MAVGRDYADVPPTRGVYKGEANSELSVAVHIVSHEEPITPSETPDSPQWILADGTHIITPAEM